MEEIYQGNNENKELTLMDLMRKVKAFWILLKQNMVRLIAFGILGGAAGFILAKLYPIKYVAMTTFVVEDDKSSTGLSGALGIASSLGFDLGGAASSAFTGANLIELLKSRKIIEQTLFHQASNKFPNQTLAEEFIQVNGLRDKWEKKNPELNKRIQFPLGLDRDSCAFLQDSVLAVIYYQIANKDLIVFQKDKKLSIITVEMKSKSEHFSKAFAEAIISEVSQLYVETKSKKARNNLEILQRQADSVRSELNSSIRSVAVANDNVYNLNPALNAARTPSSQRQVDVQANNAVLIELVKNLELAKISVRKETPLIQLIDKPILPLRKEKKSRIIFSFVGGALFVFFSILYILFKHWRKKIVL